MQAVKAITPVLLDTGHKSSENTKALNAEFNAKTSVKWKEIIDMILFYATGFYKRQSFLRQVLNVVSLQYKQPEALSEQDSL